MLYNLVIIGEAVKQLSDETRSRSPDVPWRQIAGLRDLLAHQYFRIRIEQIDEIVETHLPLLHTAVEDLVDDSRE